MFHVKLPCFSRSCMQSRTSTGRGGRPRQPGGCGRGCSVRTRPAARPSASSTCSRRTNSPAGRRAPPRRGDPVVLARLFPGRSRRPGAARPPVVPIPGRVQLGVHVRPDDPPRRPPRFPPAAPRSTDGCARQSIHSIGPGPTGGPAATIPDPRRGFRDGAGTGRRLHPGRDPLPGQPVGRSRPPLRRKSPAGPPRRRPLAGGRVPDPGDHPAPGLRRRGGRGAFLYPSR